MPRNRVTQPTFSRPLWGRDRTAVATGGTPGATGATGPASAWGTIPGTLSDQLDLDAALDLKAPLASPALTGTPTAPTAAAGTNTTQLATTAYARAEIAALVASSPATLDTLDELAAALGDDPNFATTLATALGTKEALANKNAASGYAGLDASSKLNGAQQVYGTAANTAAQGNDARLSDARTPTAHTASHAAGGTDALTLTEAQITNLVTDLAAKEASANKNANNGYAGLDAAGNLALGLLSNGTFTSLDSTATGAQNNWAPGFDGNTFVTWHGASDLTVTGLAGGAAGLVRVFKNTGSAIAWFAHSSASSLAAARLQNLITSAATPVAPKGWIVYQHDGTDYKLVGHEQGDFITPAYNAADFVGVSGMVWTVAAGDVTQYKFKVEGRTCTLIWSLENTSVSGTLSNQVRIAIPNGMTCPALTLLLGGCTLYDNSNTVSEIALIQIVAGGAVLQVIRIGGGTFSASTNLTHLFHNGFRFQVT